MNTAKKLLMLLEDRGRASLIYLLRDEFTTDEAAPLTSPRTCEPGPGTLTLSGLEIDHVYISGGELHFPSQGSGNWGDFLVQNTALTTGTGDLIGMRVFAPTNPSVFYGPSHKTSGGWYWTSSWGPGFRTSVQTITSGEIVVEGSWCHFIRTSNHSFKISGGLLIFVFEDGPFGNNAVFVQGKDDREFSIADVAVLNLPANGYTAWDADFSTVTDSKTNPATGTDFTLPSSTGWHFTGTFTWEAAKEVEFFLDNVGGAGVYQYIRLGLAASMYLSFYTSPPGGPQQLRYSTGPFTADVQHKFDVIREGDAIKLFVDNVLKYSSASDAAGVATNGVGKLSTNLATNDIVFSTHPYPALGIATDRVMCPQTTSTFTHEPDFLLYARGVTPPPAGVDSIIVRHVDNSNRILLHVYSTGALLLTQQISGSYHSRISGGVGSLSSGDDLCLVMEGANAQIFVNGVSVGSSSAVVDTDATSGNFSINDDLTIDSIEIFPRDVTSLLPSELV